MNSGHPQVPVRADQSGILFQRVRLGVIIGLAMQLPARLREEGPQIHAPWRQAQGPAEKGQIVDVAIDALADPGELDLQRQMATVPGLDPVESVSYAPVGGVDELRQLWKEEMIRKNPSLRGVPISLPVVAPGLTPGISTAAELYVNPGDVVIIPDLFWDNYELIFTDRQQAKIVSFPFFDEAWNFNLAGLEETIRKNSGSGKIVLLLNFPTDSTADSSQTHWLPLRRLRRLRPGHLQLHWLQTTPDHRR